MHHLIAQVRGAIPFDMPEAQVCLDGCEGCSRKLLEYLETELTDWERRIDEGDIPNFGDLNTLAKSSRKIHAVLKKNGLIDDEV